MFRNARWEFVGTWDDAGGAVNGAGEWIATASGRCSTFTGWPAGTLPNGNGVFRTWAKGSWDGDLDNQPAISTVTSAPVVLPCL